MRRRTRVLAAVGTVAAVSTAGTGCAGTELGDKLGTTKASAEATAGRVTDAAKTAAGEATESAKAAVTTAASATGSPTAATTTEVPSPSPGPTVAPTTPNSTQSPAVDGPSAADSNASGLSRPEAAAKCIGDDPAHPPKGLPTAADLGVAGIWVPDIDPNKDISAVFCIQNPGAPQNPEKHRPKAWVVADDNPEYPGVAGSMLNVNMAGAEKAGFEPISGPATVSDGRLLYSQAVTYSGARLQPGERERLANETGVVVLCGDRRDPNAQKVADKFQNDSVGIDGVKGTDGSLHLQFVSL